MLVTAYAKIYNVNADTMMAVLKCESGYQPWEWNKSDPYGGSKGIAQFLDPTFYHYAKEAGIEHPNIWDSAQQIETTAYMFSIHQERQWSCYRIIYEGMVRS